jgi:hypothetical protein
VIGASAQDVVAWQDIQREATAVVASAADAGATVRVVGSAGIRMHCPDAAAVMDELERPPKDLDLVVRASDRGKLRSLMEGRGYEVDRDLLVAMEGQRFAFHHPDSDIAVDVFVEKLRFCHTIDLSGRWGLHPTTIPVEDLLLAKLQVHEPTQSDLIDCGVLLATHPVGDEGEEAIDPDYVASVLARDWGFHHDASANLLRLRGCLGGEVRLPTGRIGRARDAVAKLVEAIDGAKKTVGWRVRARVGERVQWWEDVDERQDTY